MISEQQELFSTRLSRHRDDANGGVEGHYLNLYRETAETHYHMISRMHAVPVLRRDIYYYTLNTCRVVVGFVL